MGLGGFCAGSANTCTINNSILTKQLLMSTRVVINHRTTYDYDREVALSPHLIRLRPAPHAPNLIQRYDLTVEPESHILRWQQDPFANFQARVVFPEKTRRLSINVEVVVDMVPINPFDFFLDDAATSFPFAYDADMQRDLTPYLSVTESTQLLKNYAARGVVQRLLGGGTVDFIVGVAGLVANEIGYEVRLEQGVQDARLTLQRRQGSCRDSAWLLIQLYRHFGLAARFVSGYIVQLAGGNRLGPAASGVAEDTSDLHAWCEVYLPGAGWVGIDGTSGLLVAEGHIPLAAAPLPEGAAPIVGRADAAGVEFSFSNLVRRV